MELHHKNGNHEDNKLDNLQLLCPNCHSQSDNFSALNITKKENIDKENKNKPKRNRKTKVCPMCNKNMIKKENKTCRECYLKLVKTS